MASFRAFTFALGEQNRPIQNLVSEVLTGNETLITQNPAAFNQVAQKYLPSTVGIEPREVGKHQKFVLLTTEKCRAELKLDIVLKLKPLEQSDPLYFGLSLNGEVTARPELAVYSGPIFIVQCPSEVFQPKSVPKEGILLEMTKDYKITIRVTNWNAPSSLDQEKGNSSAELSSSSDSEKIPTSRFESGYETQRVMTMTHDGTNEFGDGLDTIFAGPGFSSHATVSIPQSVPLTTMADMSEHGNNPGIFLPRTSVFNQSIYATPSNLPSGSVPFSRPPIIRPVISGNTGNISGLPQPSVASNRVRMSAAPVNNQNSSVFSAVSGSDTVKKPKIKLQSSVSLPQFDPSDPDAELVDSTILQLKLLADLGFQSDELIYGFLAKNKLDSLLLSLTAGERADLDLFAAALRNRYQATPAAATAKFNAIKQLPKEDEQELLNRIMRTFNLVRGVPVSTPISARDQSLISERFISSLRDSKIRLQLRQFQTPWKNLVETSRSFRQAREWYQEVPMRPIRDIKI